MILLGIDPGSRKCGYGILHIDKYKIIAAGCGIIKLDEKKSLQDRLLELYNHLSKLIDEYKPDVAAVEEIFFGKNLHSAFTLGNVRGVILLLLKMNNILTYNYSPREIKQSVTGKGSASKKQIEYVIQSILNLKQAPKEDAADALAIAMCLFNKEKFNLLKTESRL
ncbi:MAG: crossover junction endodeoxyribonuclease RuvC [Candidatus Cloacimonetes bacterium]|jgi:crossover junction endodeoxyribonuclease RuvC|nr:crossover junction endodeoxyribonuclease RuvC [Candidatus Cloacimonadota bacterium]MDD4156235.1 crossover junction endodeoxyribonuclease RuvC [Candidatus Cloacimonadota bacterium]